MRAAIYVRRSVKKDDEQSGSLEDQERLCRELCQKNDWEVVEVYKDEMTGTTDQRPDLQRMLTDKSNFDVVVIYSTSRLGRSLVNTIDLANELPGVVSVTDAFDTSDTTASGKVIRTIFALFAEIFIDQLRESVTASQERQLEARRWPGGPPPYGFAKDDEHRLVPVPDEVKALQRMAELVIDLNGEAADVARQLDREGFRRRGGKKFGDSTREIRLRMSQRYLTGFITWKEHPIPIEPVLDDATLSEVRYLLGKTAKPHSRRGDGAQWLSGLVDCSCGGHYVSAGRHGRTEVFRYKCSNRSSDTPVDCNYDVPQYKWPSARRFETEVWDSLVDTFRLMGEMDPDEIRTVDLPYLPQPKVNEETPDPEDLDPLRDTLARLRQVCVSTAADVRESKEDVAVLRELERRRDDAERELQAARDRNVEAGHDETQDLYLSDLIGEADRLDQMTDPAERRKVLEMSGIRVKLHDVPVTFAGTTYVWRFETS